MNKDSKIYVAGHTGLIGGAIYRCLIRDSYQNIIVRTHAELELENEQAVRDFFEKERPEYVFLCAAKAGGIKDNSEKPAEFIYRNLKIQTNVIDSAYQSKVKKLLFMGSACVYPKLASQPIKEDSFLTGLLEPTNEAYAVAKIAGISMCQSYRKQYGCDFISVMPANAYGPGDHFEIERSHVIPALIRKFHDAKTGNKDRVTLWGTGSAIREFLHCDDIATASVFLMQKYSSPEIINIGTGKGFSIKELSLAVKDIVEFKGDVEWDTTKPDGMPIRILDTKKINNIGWTPSINLVRGLKETYNWFQTNVKNK